MLKKTLRGISERGLLCGGLLAAVRSSGTAPRGGRTVSGSCRIGASPAQLVDRAKERASFATAPPGAPPKEGRHAAKDNLTRLRESAVRVFGVLTGVSRIVPGVLTWSRRRRACPQAGNECGSPNGSQHHSGSHQGVSGNVRCVMSSCEHSPRCRADVTPRGAKEERLRS